MTTQYPLKIETFPVGSFQCNCSLIYSTETKEAIAIDPGNDAQAFLKVVKARQLTLKMMIHTHAHFDHIGQSNFIRKQLGGVPIYLHKEDKTLYEALPEQGLFFGETLERPDPVDSYIDDDQRFSLAVRKDDIKDKRLLEILKTIYTPGHTGGSCSFYMDCLEKPILFSGDTLFHESIGRTDLPGGNYNQIIKSIKQRLLKLPEETICIPGHGLNTSLFHEKKHNQFLK